MGYDSTIGLVKRYINENKKYDIFYILRIDISKYFYSIDHDILKGLLIDKLKCDEYNIVCSIKNTLLVKDKNRTREIDKLPLYE